MSQIESMLEQAAKDGSIELEQWPHMLSVILQKLQETIHQFPSPQTQHDLTSYHSSVRCLQRDFSQAPPYTLQRLAELVLNPRKHYRFLPAYLRALDRVVSVSSPVSDFPLPTANVNGMQEREGLGSDESLGGALLTPIPWLRNEEFHSERIDTILGPNGAGSIETVSVTVNGVPSASSAAHTSPSTSTPASPTLSEQSDASTNSSGSISTDAQLREQGGITQGELLRQEQQAGVVPTAQPRRRTMEEEEPHARGPDEIGMADTGVVAHPGVLDIEGAVGRRSKSPQPPPVVDDKDDEMEGAETEDKTEAVAEPAEPA